VTTQPGADAPLCYVIMPFSKAGGWDADRWDQFFELELRPLITAEGYRCERSTATRGNIVKQIVQNLNNARLVVADLTGLNFNVLYELGVRHSLSRRTIMITQDNPDLLPFDLKSYGCRQYSLVDPHGQTGFKTMIHELIEHVRTDPDADDSPVADFVNIRQQAESDAAKSLLHARLDALFRELSDVQVKLVSFGSQATFAPIMTHTPAADGMLAVGAVANDVFLRKLSGFIAVLQATSMASAVEQPKLIDMAKGLGRSLSDDCIHLLAYLEVGSPLSDAPITRLADLSAYVGYKSRFTELDENEDHDEA
jgi:hypothetical protein